MYLTTLKFKRALEWFLQSSYEYLLLYASGSERLDYEMVEEFLRYKDVIDRQTGKMVCFMHFIEKQRTHPNSSVSIIEAEHKPHLESFMLYHIKTEEAKELTRGQLYYGVGLEATYETTDDICSFLRIKRISLPAFILIHKNRNEHSIDSFANQYSIFPIKSKSDFFALLKPIKLANDFKIDLNNIECQLEAVQLEPSYTEVQQDIEAIKERIEKQQTEKKEEFTERPYAILKEINAIFTEYEIPIIIGLVRPYMIKKTLSHAGMLKEFMDNHNQLYYKYKSVFYKSEKWNKRKTNTIINLQSELMKKESLLVQSQTKETRISNLEGDLKYTKELYKKKFEEELLISDASTLIDAITNNSITLPMILENTIETYIHKEALIESIVNEIREQVKKKQFDVFISCKSEDYTLGEEVYAFLKSKDYKPFIASKSLREIGNDNYSAVISEVIDICRHMIVFASNLLYVETPYVKSEWNMFCNEIKAGRKKGKLLTILQDPKEGDNLPIDLRSREVLPASGYKDYVCNYLSQESYIP